MVHAKDPGWCSEQGKPEDTKFEPAEHTAAVHKQQPAVHRHAADAVSHDVTPSAHWDCPLTLALPLGVPDADTPHLGLHHSPSVL
jgi:hypothetical protein